jgi:hypothetical protein
MADERVRCNAGSGRLALAYRVCGTDTGAGNCHTTGIDCGRISDEPGGDHGRSDDAR